MIGGTSRYINCEIIQHSDRTRELSARIPFRFRDLPGTRTHVVTGGDTLFSIAHEYFSPAPRAAGFWWAIADFQPEPISDPTLALAIGRELYIPSSEILFNRILRVRP